MMHVFLVTFQKSSFPSSLTAYSLIMIPSPQTSIYTFDYITFARHPQCTFTALRSHQGKTAAEESHTKYRKTPTLQKQLHDMDASVLTEHVRLPGKGNRHIFLQPLEREVRNKYNKRKNGGEANMCDKVLMTTGFYFDGFSIEKHIGVFSGECALGTGFLSSLKSDVSDILGMNSKAYTDKLREAKDHALEQLREQTIRAGGNAVIGLSINYTMFSRDIIGVIANGTAVKIDAIRHDQFSDEVIPVLKYNKNIAFRPISLHGHSVQDQYAFSIELFYDLEEDTSSILVDMKFITVFGKIYDLKDVAFTNFSFTRKKHLVSDYTRLSIPSCENISLLKNVIVVTKKYIQNDELFDFSCSDLEHELVGQEYQYGEKPPMDEIEELSSGKEIYEYLKTYMEKYGHSEPELMERLAKLVNVERFYGNSKRDVIQYIKDYYKFDSHE